MNTATQRTAGRTSKAASAAPAGERLAVDAYALLRANRLSDVLALAASFGGGK